MQPCYRMLILSALATMLVPATAWASVSPDQPMRHVEGKFSYVSGGSDPAKAPAMRALAANYPLELDFLWGRGAKETPVTMVQWSIKNSAGQALLTASSSGPVVLASIPDGHYIVVARYEGKELTRIADVRKGRRDVVVLEWPQ